MAGCELPARRETAACLLEKAAQCRRLATELVGDLTGDALIKLAEKFERRGALYLTESTRRRMRSML